jgi:hypothetical protein
VTVANLILAQELSRSTGGLMWTWAVLYAVVPRRLDSNRRDN